MATESALAPVHSQRESRPGGRRRTLVWCAAALVLVLALAVAVVLLWSGASLASDASALARVSVQPLGGSVEAVEAFGPGGRPIPIAVGDGRRTPLRKLRPGEQVSLAVRVRRPGWLAWALGDERTEHLTLHAPVAHLTQRWITVRPGGAVRVSFDRPVSAVARESGGLAQAGAARSRTLAQAQRTISRATALTGR